ncbi:MAG: hypothetical protein NTV98_03230 [Candidatus Roizmanbacteria bacterium]|nr:hypothetical protein [Candidatus Roizmanbacteria bacterium]
MKKNMIWLVTGVIVLVGVGLAIFFSQQKPKVTEQPQKSVPNGTTSVDYELSYDTKGQGKQGVIGTISSISGNSFEKQMTLGTCSSGRCVYHEVIGAIQVTLKFTGEYGEKVLSKEFTL